MNVVLIVVLLGCTAVAAADGYRAVTGRRLSKKPSRRTDQEMRRQSAIAAGVLGSLSAVLAVFIVIRMSHGL